MTSQSVDGTFFDSILYARNDHLTSEAVPELQGTTQEIAIAKCKVAAEKVEKISFAFRELS